MYTYFFTCCGKTHGYTKEAIDEDFTGWSCPNCGKPVSKDKLYKIWKDQPDANLVLYDYRTDGPYRGLKKQKSEMAAL